VERNEVTIAGDYLLQLRFMVLISMISEMKVWSGTFLYPQLRLNFVLNSFGLKWTKSSHPVIPIHEVVLQRQKLASTVGYQGSLWKL
jgi:hypothetical protein